MISPDAIEKKSRNAFAHVRKDILNLHKIIESLQNDLNQLKASDLQIADQLIMVNQAVQKALSKSSEIKVIKSNPQVIKQTKVVYKNASKSTSYVAAKDGKKFHTPTCPFAKNILPKKRVVFKTKESALNNGLKECKCLLK